MASHTFPKYFCSCRQFVRCVTFKIVAIFLVVMRLTTAIALAASDIAHERVNSRGFWLPPSMKYSCTNIFHRRSLYTFYKALSPWEDESANTSCPVGAFQYCLPKCRTSWMAAREDRGAEIAPRFAWHQLGHVACINEMRDNITDVPTIGRTTIWFRTSNTRKITSHIE